MRTVHVESSSRLRPEHASTTIKTMRKQSRRGQFVRNRVAEPTTGNPGPARA
ncbi:hypothetical protein [Lysobacter gummosus]|uniref:hypothetical protein n=1 Tax=Lysobacter gummosus TaxID=262324 RepID=UPI00363E836D